MSIWNNLFIGISGLDAHGTAISVVGDNIANVSTVGFKASRAGFSDVMGGMVGSARLGAGVRMDGSLTNLEQGVLQQTGGVLDLAVRGRGFFVVGGNHNGIDSTYYTRDGRFAMDNEGQVVNHEGLRLQGYLFSAAGVQGTQLGSLNLGSMQSAPVPSTSVQMKLNLESSSVAPGTFDAADPNTTSNFTTSTTVYDSLGNTHRVDLYFRSDGAGTWDWHGLVDGAQVGGVAGTPTEIANGTLTFNTSGALDVETLNASSANFTGATPGQAITFDFGDAITTDAGTGLAGTTQFSGASVVNSTSQNGFGAGSLVDIVVDENGTIDGLFSNGQRREVARVALATFAADDQLERAGTALFRETTASGQALVDSAATGARGSISAGTVETSNVDLTNELVTLIAYQRAFQANVKTVQTADEMLQEVANLKR
jgi:flagellar hook protein FlgE